MKLHNWCVDHSRDLPEHSNVLDNPDIEDNSPAARGPLRGRSVQRQGRQQRRPQRPACAPRFNSNGAPADQVNVQPRDRPLFKDDIAEQEFKHRTDTIKGMSCTEHKAFIARYLQEQNRVRPAPQSAQEERERKRKRARESRGN